MTGEMSATLDDLPRIDLPDGISARLLGMHDADILAQLRERVVREQLGAPDCYRLEAEGPDFPEDHLVPLAEGGRGLIMGLFDSTQQLIAYGALSLPRPGESSRADALNLQIDEHNQLAYLASAMVCAEYRGMGLHHALVAWRLDMTRSLGRRHAVAAFWPGNHRSWAHLTQKGLQGKKLVRVGPGWPRILAHRDLFAPEPLADPRTRHLVPLAELAEQQAMFDQGYWLWRRVILSEAIFAELARPHPMESAHA